uniref:Uncharacterized protein n=1 Tax=Myoviridae sp. ctlRg1 TaxID=2826692 RepID=A0A8S5M6T8_9CAUD|nr:MAG TPA: hypothetical protein [Myoviridae sp. ctlRg1]
MQMNGSVYILQYKGANPIHKGAQIFWHIAA